jgi:hypothetical protein
MIYRSRRRLTDLAEGLIEGGIAHFGEVIEVRREDLPSEDGQGVGAASSCSVSSTHSHMSISRSITSAVPRW